MIEVIAVIFSLASTILSARKNIWSWPIGIIGVVAYFFIFQQNRDWNNMSLQIIFLLQSVYGWFVWNQGSSDNVSKLDNILSLSLVFVLLTPFLYFISIKFNGNSNLLDSVTACLSLIGMILLAHKKIENWILWAVADFLYIGLFIQNKLYLSAGLYFIFLLIAIWGFIDWKKQIK
jgi:nicotinamide mononucleotide transporter